MRALVILTTLAGFVACGGGETPPPVAPSGAGATPSAVTGAGVPVKTFSEQIALGQALFRDHCAECHGAGGEGGEAPRLVGMGEGALPLAPPAPRKLRKTPFRTAADVADFVINNMPPKKAGSLTEPQYMAIVAFDLHANGVDLERPLDRASAKDVVLHE